MKVQGASRIRVAMTAVAVIIILLQGGGALAAGATLSEQDKTCLGCHGTAGLQKKLAGGETLSLHVQGKIFAESVHAVIGCAACHSSVDLKSHPSVGRKINSSREYTVAQIEVCRTCHEDKFKLYEGSIHAALLRDGNPIAPVCTDCHSPHEVRPKTADVPIAEVPCRNCHGEIFDAYAGSVHGLARSKSATGGAPLCAGCHRAHDIAVPSTSEHTRDACLGCHQNVLRAHQEWLPNTGLHLQVVSCPACHAPSAQRRVDLRLYDSTGKKRIWEKEGVPQFEALARSADVKGAGLNALALQSLLKDFNREGGDGAAMTLRGRLEVRTGPEAHQLVAKSKALRECATCHQAGAEAFQSVTISIVDPDGRPLRYGAQNEVLNSVVSIDSVRGFYAIGGTRIKLLDWLLALAFLSGIAVPVGHQTLRWLFGRYARKIRDQEAQRAQAAAPGTPAGRPPE